VLVVESDDVNRWLAARLLEQKGYRVKTVTNGEAALAILEHESFDLILMDIQMPLLDGLTVTRTIRQREQHTGTRVPIIAFTSEATDTQTQHYWQAGMDSYLTKPIHTDEFYRTTEAVLTLHQRLSQATDLPPVFAAEEALHQLGGDFELLQQVAERFFNTAPHLLSAMRRAIAKDDSYNLDFAAHRLHGLASNLAAHAVIELAERLELMGSIRNMSQAQFTLATLEEEIKRFRAVFEAAQQKLLAQS
jgi:CheY-like chemotaxis protein